MTTEEKLALCIAALLKISGDPNNDPEWSEQFGEAAITWPSTRIARETLTTLGVDMTAPGRKKLQ